MEDGVEQCRGGIDDDADGLIDSEETECVSSVNAYGLLPGPIAVGIGGDRKYVEFDVAMRTVGGVTGSSTMMGFRVKVLSAAGF